mmetsp:Transcript_5710/g.9271  ORF Transcript_5710/g.9271 Transcript_5710/m.9271 type:complete len:542 (+) Transcript_5710:3-1628(+)
MPYKERGYAFRFATATSVNAAKVSTMPQGRRVLLLEGLCEAAGRAWSPKFMRCKKDQPGELQAEIDPNKADEVLKLKYIDQAGSQLEATEIECKFKALTLFTMDKSLPYIGLRLDFHTCLPVVNEVHAATVIFGIAPAADADILVATKEGTDSQCDGLKAPGCVLCEDTGVTMPSWKAAATCAKYKEVDALNLNTASSVSGTHGTDTYKVMNFVNFFDNICSDKPDDTTSLDLQNLIMGSKPPTTPNKCFASTASMKQFSSSTGCFKDILEFTMQDEAGTLAMLPIRAENWTALKNLIPDPPAGPDPVGSDSWYPYKNTPATVAVDRVCVHMPTCKCETSCDHGYFNFTEGQDYVTTPIPTTPMPLAEIMASDICNECTVLEFFIGLTCALITAASARCVLFMRKFVQDDEKITRKTEEASDTVRLTEPGKSSGPEEGRGDHEIYVYTDGGDRLLFLVALPVLLFTVSFLWCTIVKVLAREFVNEWVGLPRGCPCESILPYQFATFLICWITTLAIAYQQTFLASVAVRTESEVYGSGPYS